jgi:GntR family transcriptional regulator
MIEFHLDGRSPVATYKQLVQQVRQALRVGLLEHGDQLPTVLKAYRELEHEGLVKGRPGLGTFVVRSLAGPSLASQAGLRRELEAWLGRARAAGLDQEDVVALVETTLRSSFQEGVA